jgi:hypothetical protein
MRNPTDYIRVLNAGAKPDSGQDFTDFARDQFRHEFRSLREDLIIMPWRFAHHFLDVENELVTDPFVKEVAHRVHEDLSGLSPLIRDRKRLAVLAHHAAPHRPLA